MPPAKLLQLYSWRKPYRINCFSGVMNHLPNVRVHFHPALYQTAGVQNWFHGRVPPKASPIAFSELSVICRDRNIATCLGTQYSRGGVCSSCQPGECRNVRRLFLDHINTDREAPLFVKHLPGAGFPPLRS